MMPSSRASGFTLIEVLVLIIVSALMMTTFILGGNIFTTKAPSIHQQWVANQTARQCMEWFIDQRRLIGYTALTCPSTPAPSACAAPTGYTVSTSISCTTWNGDDTYKTITVTVSGLANSTLSTMVGK